MVPGTSAVPQASMRPRPSEPTTLAPTPRRRSLRLLRQRGVHRNCGRNWHCTATANRIYTALQLRHVLASHCVAFQNLLHSVITLQLNTTDTATAVAPQLRSLWDQNLEQKMAKAYAHAMTKQLLLLPFILPLPCLLPLSLVLRRLLLPSLFLPAPPAFSYFSSLYLSTAKHSAPSVACLLVMPPQA